MIPYDELQCGHLYRVESLRKGFKVAIYIGEGRYFYAVVDPFFDSIDCNCAYDVRCENSPSAIVRPLEKLEEVPAWVEWKRGLRYEIGTTNNMIEAYLLIWYGRIKEREGL